MNASAPPQRPAPLAVAAVVAGIEGLGLVAFAFAVLASFSGARATMGVTTAVFFLVYGSGLAVAARGLFRRQSWSRAPVVLAQLIQLGVAWSFRGGSSTVAAIVLAVLAVIVLVGVLSPASLRATSAEQDGEPV